MDFPEGPPDHVREIAMAEAQRPPIDFNLEVLTTDDDITEAIKVTYPQFIDLIPLISRLNSLSYIKDDDAMDWWKNEVELLLEERVLEVDETDIAAWNFLKNLRFRLLMMIQDAYKGHKSRSIRERRTVIGWEPQERQKKRGWFR